MTEAAEAIRKAIEDHLFEISGRTVQVTASIGIAPSPKRHPKPRICSGRAHTASAEVRKQPWP